MNDPHEWILHLTGASRVVRQERVQSLWGGYGELVRVHLYGSELPSVVCKHIRPPRAPQESERGHRRKLRSYAVETTFYRSFAARTNERCRVARLLGARESDGQRWLLLEDLDDAGYPERKRSLRGADLETCARWLAAFHACFLGQSPTGLWPTGTYWHLATRPDELANVHDAAIVRNAPEWDRQLSACRFSTFVHGDAKAANFCFARRSGAVAAVDFQYVGGGPGSKDLAYLLYGETAATEARVLDRYFAALGAELGVDAAAPIESEWRALYPIARHDFARFLAGWR